MISYAIIEQGGEKTKVDIRDFVAMTLREKSKLLLQDDVQFFTANDVVVPVREALQVLRDNISEYRA